MDTDIFKDIAVHRGHSGAGRKRGLALAGIIPPPKRHPKRGILIGPRPSQRKLPQKEGAPQKRTEGAPRPDLQGARDLPLIIMGGRLGHFLTFAGIPPPPQKRPKRGILTGPRPSQRRLPQKEGAPRKKTEGAPVLASPGGRVALPHSLSDLVAVFVPDLTVHHGGPRTVF